MNTAKKAPMLVWETSKKGNTYAYSKNKTTGTVFAKKDSDGGFGFCLQGRRKTDPVVFSGLRFKTQHEAQDAVEVHLLDPDFDMAEFKRLQEWKTSKAGNPYTKLNGSICTVFEKDGGFRFVCEEVYSRSFETKEDAMEAVDGLKVAFTEPSCVMKIVMGFFDAIEIKSDSIPEDPEPDEFVTSMDDIPF